MTMQGSRRICLLERRLGPPNTLLQASINSHGTKIPLPSSMILNILVWPNLRALPISSLLICARCSSSICILALQGAFASYRHAMGSKLAKNFKKQSYTLFREFTLHDSENLFPENLQAEHNAPCSFISDADDRLYFLLQTETIFFWCFQLNFEASTYTFACKHSLLDNRKYWSLDDNKLYALHEDGRSTDCYEIAESINFARDTRFFLPKSAYGTALRQWCFFDGKLFIFSFCTEYERNTNATKMETLKTICYWLPNDRHTHSLSTLPLPDSFLQLEAWANEKTEENVVREEK